MNESQILSTAIVVGAVLAGAFFNNAHVAGMNNRIGDVNRRIDDMRDLLRAEMAKNHSEMLHRFGDLDTRLSRIEERFMR